MHPANKLNNLRRRVNRAKKFPNNTCPASRHLHIMAETLVKGKKNFDDSQCAGAMLSVLESLWKVRTELTRLKNKCAFCELSNK
jgi:hypothetical protein